MSKSRSNSNTLKQTKYNLAVVGGGAVGKSAFTTGLPIFNYRQ